MYQVLCFQEKCLQTSVEVIYSTLIYGLTSGITRFIWIGSVDCVNSKIPHESAICVNSYGEEYEAFYK